MKLKVEMTLTGETAQKFRETGERRILSMGAAVMFVLGFFGLTFWSRRLR